MSCVAVADSCLITASRAFRAAEEIASETSSDNLNNILHLILGGATGQPDSKQCFEHLNPQSGATGLDDVEKCREAAALFGGGDPSGDERKAVREALQRRLAEVNAALSSSRGGMVREARRRRAVVDTKLAAEKVGINYLWVGR